MSMRKETILIGRGALPNPTPDAFSRGKDGIDYQSYIEFQKALPGQEVFSSEELEGFSILRGIGSFVSGLKEAGQSKVFKTLAPLIVAGTLGGLVLAGCGKNETTTVPSVSTTGITQPITTESTTTLPTTTTAGETTTTTEATTTTTEVTTTTTEQKTGIDANLVSKERTLADVTGKIEIGKILTKPVGEIPADLQKLFQSKNPQNKILYVGKANEGDKMNAVVTDKLWKFKTMHGQEFNFFGGNPESAWGDYPQRAVMEFLDVILIPDSEDFYMRGQNPLTGSEMYVRMTLGNEKTLDYPSTFYFDLGIDPQVVVGKNRTWNHFLASHKIGDIIQPGDILYISFVAFGKGGSLQDPGSIKWDVVVDERGVQYAGRVLFSVFNEADKAKYEKLFE
ncbi:MAG: hypothetical protein A2W22_01375 [Candidatus Levybacteria bacterium RBG_16_35_11]|nr:MAG: hypothetical protein A2W22_01375 [Candidatus Levybacteria bacterium RBG_16_35_11]